MSILPDLIATHEAAQAKSWIWQRAAEIAYQSELQQQLKHASRTDQKVETESPPVLLQAAFCIDVRSEVIRRALEAQDSRVETLGFAGFFGLPIEYQPAGTDVSRPQLPGLLKSGIKVTPVMTKVSKGATKQA
ncbi:putative inorganic carbon transporter subunit DabA, partial [Thiomicrorhabdus heinhorstiae]